MFTALQQRVCDDLASRAEAMLADLASHVAIPTGKSHRPGLERYAAALVGRLTALGAIIERHPGSPRPSWLDVNPQPVPFVPDTIVARHAGADPHKPRVLIAGHIDTVHDPHGPFQTLALSADGQTAAGPGAADMKGGILIALCALEALHRAEVDLNWSFLLNADEETGSFHSDATLCEEARKHDVGIAVEPALPGGALAVERMGSAQFMIEVRGRSAHVGRDFAKGVSAVTKLGEILAELGRWPDLSRGLIVNVGPLKGGDAANVVPDHAAAWGNARFKDPDLAAEIEARMLALATHGDALPKVTVHYHCNRPAKPFAPGTRGLAERARRVAAQLGQALPSASTGGVCDGNILQHAGLPTLDTLGVRGGGLHTTDEWIEVPSLVQRAQLLALLLMDVAT